MSFAKLNLTDFIIAAVVILFLMIFVYIYATDKLNTYYAKKMSEPVTVYPEPPGAHVWQGSLK